MQGLWLYSATCKDMCVHMHACIHARTYVHMNVLFYGHTRVQASHCVHMCVRIVCTCVYVCICVCMCVGVHVSVRMCRGVHTFSHAETSKHYTSVWAQPSDTFSQEMSDFQGSHFTFQVPHLLCAFGHISQYLLTSFSSFVNGDNKRISLSTLL